MVMLLFAGLLLYGIWKIHATTMVLRIHADDPDEKIVLIPNRREPYNPLVAQVAVLRELAKTKRRKWVALSAYSVVAIFGAFDTLGLALIGLAVVYGEMVLIDLLTPRPTFFSN